MTKSPKDTFDKHLFGGGKVDKLKEVLEGAAPKTVVVPSEAEKAEIDKLKEELQKKGEETKESQEKYLRTLAEFENSRKRMEREKDDLVKYGLQKYVKEMLSVLDHLEMTLAHADEAKINDPLVEGVRLVVKEFLGVLEKFGLKEITGEGRPFDPHRQEAIGQIETADTAAGCVVTVHRKGFILYDRVIRPALVTVAKEPVENDKGEEDSGESTVH
ncbi:MAG: nucleotide exchange factor GrpE [Deltaproteobacteria bacterium]|nr:nucleotide exchange factor GrpE [Deltaproteobacteria bacterium]